MDKVVFSHKDQKAFASLLKQGPLGKRALHILQYLLLRRDFSQLVSNFRKKANIPEQGFDIPSDTNKLTEFMSKFSIDGWSDDEIVYSGILNMRIKDRDLLKTVDEYVEKSGVLSFAPEIGFADNFVTSIVREYTLFNDFLGLYKGSFATTSIPTYDFLDENVIDEIRFEVPISVKKEELIDYINSVWPTLDRTKKQKLITKDLVRFRPRTNFFRDIQILNKYLEIEELSTKQRKERGIRYIEVEVRKQLKEAGLTNLPDSDTIRTIVSNLKNHIKNINVLRAD